MLEQALAGLKIAVTRPRLQAMSLAQRIGQAGGIALLCPLLEISAVPESPLLQAQVSRLAEFGLAIFISPNAVQYGMAAIAAAGGLPATLKIAAVGQGSASALRHLGIQQVLVPATRFDSEGLLALPELQQVAGVPVLIFRADSGRELLGDTLKLRGAKVEYATCYRRRKITPDASLLQQADALTVSSSEALEALWQSFGLEQRNRLGRLPLFVQHQRLAEMANRQGWQQVLLAGTGDEGLLTALFGWGISRQKTG